MTTALKMFKRRPTKGVVVAGKKKAFSKKDWEGKGFYYRKKGGWVKYHKGTDLKKRVPTRKPHLAPKWRHTHDSKVVRGRGGRIIGKI
jgi:hypothetical protein